MEASTQESSHIDTANLRQRAPGDDLHITDEDADMVLTIIRQYRDKLCALKSNPKGMTHGDVQNHLAACDRILG